MIKWARELDLAATDEQVANAVGPRISILEEEPIDWSCTYDGCDTVPTEPRLNKSVRFKQNSEEWAKIMGSPPPIPEGDWSDVDDDTPPITTTTFIKPPVPFQDADLNPKELKVQEEKHALPVDLPQVPRRIPGQPPGAPPGGSPPDSGDDAPPGPDEPRPRREMHPLGRRPDRWRAPCKLTDEQMAFCVSLVDAPVFQGTGGHDHPMSAFERIVAEETLLGCLRRIGCRSVLDVGGNATRHYAMRRSGVWSAAPRLDNADLFRNRGLTNPPYRFCNHLGQDCNCREFDAAMAIHLYSLTPSDILAIVRKTAKRTFFLAIHTYAEPWGIMWPAKIPPARQSGFTNYEAEYEVTAGTVHATYNGCSTQPYVHASPQWMLANSSVTMLTGTLAWRQRCTVGHTTIWEFTEGMPEAPKPRPDLAIVLKDMNYYGLVNFNVDPTQVAVVPELKAVANKELYSMGAHMVIGKPDEHIIVPKDLVQYLASKVVFKTRTRANFEVLRLTAQQRLTKYCLPVRFHANALTYSIALAFVGNLGHERAAMSMVHGNSVDMQLHEHETLFDMAGWRARLAAFRVRLGWLTWYMPIWPLILVFVLMVFKLTLPSTPGPIAYMETGWGCKQLQQFSTSTNTWHNIGPSRSWATRVRYCLASWNDGTIWGVKPLDDFLTLPPVPVVSAFGPSSYFPVVILIAAFVEEMLRRDPAAWFVPIIEGAFLFVRFPMLALFFAWFHFLSLKVPLLVAALGHAFINLSLHSYGMPMLFLPQLSFPALLSLAASVCVGNWKALKRLSSVGVAVATIGIVFHGGPFTVPSAPLIKEPKLTAFSRLPLEWKERAAHYTVVGPFVPGRPVTLPENSVKAELLAIEERLLFERDPYSTDLIERLTAHRLERFDKIYPQYEKPLKPTNFFKWVSKYPAGTRTNLLRAKADLQAGEWDERWVTNHRTFQKMEKLDKTDYEGADYAPRLIQTCNDHLNARLGPWVHAVSKALKKTWTQHHYISWGSSLTAEQLGEWYTTTRADMPDHMIYVLDRSRWDGNENEGTITSLHATYRKHGFPKKITSLSYRMYARNVIYAKSGAKAKSTFRQITGSPGTTYNNSRNSAETQDFLIWQKLLQFEVAAAMHDKGIWQYKLLVAGDDLVVVVPRWLGYDPNEESAFGYKPKAKLVHWDDVEFCSSIFIPVAPRHYPATLHIRNTPLYALSPKFGRQLMKIGVDINNDKSPAKRLREIAACFLHQAPHNPLFVTLCNAMYREGVGEGRYKREEWKIYPACKLEPSADTLPFLLNRYGLDAHEWSRIEAFLAFATFPLSLGPEVAEPFTSVDC